jgi:DNA-binding Xre family transcriptional regulator
MAKKTLPSVLDQQLAQFLRQTRGDQTLAVFSRKVGLPLSTLYRLEQCEQSISLGRLYQIMTHLKCDLSDIFQDRDWRHAAEKAAPFIGVTPVSPKSPDSK